MISLLIALAWGFGLAFWICVGILLHLRLARTEQALEHARSFASVLVAKLGEVERDENVPQEHRSLAKRARREWERREEIFVCVPPETAT